MNKSSKTVPPHLIRTGRAGVLDERAGVVRLCEVAAVSVFMRRRQWRSRLVAAGGPEVAVQMRYLVPSEFGQKPCLALILRGTGLLAVKTVAIELD